MQYKVKFLEQALKEFNELSDNQQKLLKEDYLRIENISMDCVLTRPLGKKFLK